MDGEGGDRDEGVEGPVSVELLADLQAGRLDDHAAARLRQRVRTDPAVAARWASLEHVRRELAALSGTPADDVPDEVTARIGAALRAQRPRRVADRLRRLAAVIGMTAAVAGAVVGATTLVRDDPASASSAAPSAASRDGVPLTDDQILDLLRQPADLGGLAVPTRRASCLGGLGYRPSTPLLGARPLAVRGTPGVLMLLADDMPGRLDAVVVAPNCSAADTGLLARRIVARR